MSDRRLSNVTAGQTAYIPTSGMLIPKDGTKKVVVTDVLAGNARPVILRQHSSDNVQKGVLGKAFLTIPISGSSHFTAPPISAAGVNIFNATVDQGVSVKYHFQDEENDVFDTSSKITINLSLFSLTGLDLSNVTGIFSFESTTPVFTMTQVGSGSSQETIDPADYQIEVDGAGEGDNLELKITATGGGVEDVDNVIFRGHNMPVDSVGFSSPASNEGGQFKYLAAAAAEEENYQLFDFAFVDGPDLGLYSGGEIVVDAKIFV
tara:strand:- start:1638 stop:2426 length:789 start_codon:yes stop_codon:yes gene_type:complete